MAVSPADSGNCPVERRDGRNEVATSLVARDTAVN